MEFRLQNVESSEEDSKILGSYVFQSIRASKEDKTFCLLNWLTGESTCDDYGVSCRKDGNCDEHDRRAPCNYYDVSGSPSCRCDRYDSHGY